MHTSGGTQICNEHTRNRNGNKKKNDNDPLIALLSTFLLLLLFLRLLHHKYWLLAELGHSRGSGRQSEGGEFCK